MIAYSATSVLPDPVGAATSTERPCVEGVERTALEVVERERAGRLERRRVDGCAACSSTGQGLDGASVAGMVPSGVLVAGAVVESVGSVDSVGTDSGVDAGMLDDGEIGTLGVEGVSSSGCRTPDQERRHDDHPDHRSHGDDDLLALARRPVPPRLPVFADGLIASGSFR